MPIDWDALVIAPTMAAFGETDPADPAMTPTYYPVLGPAFPLNGVFDEGFLSVVMDDPLAPVSTVNPVMGVRLADFPAGIAPGENDNVFIPRVGLTYKVQNVETDSHGWAKLQLLLKRQ